MDGFTHILLYMNQMDFTLVPLTEYKYPARYYTVSATCRYMAKMYISKL